MENNDSMEELLPVVAWLAQKYTGGESSSVTYERARYLMEAVVYCIEEGRKESGDFYPVCQEKTDAKKEYEFGYEKVRKKVEQTRLFYNDFIDDFKDYGNENYRDTVRKGIPGFFRYYDPRFAPQETLITMDYPTIKPINGLSGIDAISDYVNYIGLEQKFLQKFPEEYVVDVLTAYHRCYQKAFFNLCRVVLRHILGRMILEHPKLATGLQSILKEQNREKAEEFLKGLLHQLIWQQYKKGRELEAYLSYEIPDLAYELLQFGIEKVLM